MKKHIFLINISMQFEAIALMFGHQVTFKSLNTLSLTMLTFRGHVTLRQEN